jgi:aspartyl-tRNA(Asn)/glutamyl-tRNA(Gln) amidotransferase subunit A
LEDIRLQVREYAVMTAQEAAARVRDRSLSPVELVGAALEAIASTDDRINAWCEILGAAAMDQARVLEQEAARGVWRGPLHGVPIGVKDLFLTKGIRTRRGSRLYENSIPDETSPAVERMVAAGAIMVGKNTTPDSGWKASSNSPVYGVTRNPWDPTRTAGGSSSGSAAAVAAGTVPISLGSDGGGSLRIPAAFCGIFSLKPSLGRVPTYPLSPSEHLSHAGPMTVTVADSALALDVLKGPHDLDPNSLPDDPQSYLAAIVQPLRGVRCLLLPTLFGQTVEPDISSCVAEAFRAIARLDGVEVISGSLPWTNPIDLFDRLWVARGAPRVGMSESDKARLDPGLARLVTQAGALTLKGHLQALQDRAAFCREASRSFRDFDLLVTPMLPISPFAAERDGPEGMDEAPPVPWARWTPFSYPFNITGQPAASIPCGWTPAGHPVALQVIGRRFDDAGVLRFCAAWERAFDWRSRRPQVFPS